MFNIPSEDFLYRALVTTEHVNFTDVDMYQHMNTSAYITKLVDHRSAILDRLLKVSLNDILKRDRLGIVYSDIRIKFKAAALFEEELEIASWDDQIDKASFYVPFLISSKSRRTVYTYGRIRYAVIDLESGRPRPVPKFWVSSADRNLLLDHPSSDEYMKTLEFKPELLEQLKSA